LKEEMQKVGELRYFFEGSNPVDPKSPDGEIWVEEGPTQNNSIDLPSLVFYN
jgi:hypothetical protein